MMTRLLKKPTRVDKQGVPPQLLEVDKAHFKPLKETFYVLLNFICIMKAYKISCSFKSVIFLIPLYIYYSADWLPNARILI